MSREETGPQSQGKSRARILIQDRRLQRAFVKATASMSQVIWGCPWGGARNSNGVAFGHAQQLTPTSNSECMKHALCALDSVVLLLLFSQVLNAIMASGPPPPHDVHTSRAWHKTLMRMPHHHHASSCSLLCSLQTLESLWARLLRLSLKTRLPVPFLVTFMQVCPVLLEYWRIKSGVHTADPPRFFCLLNLGCMDT